MSVRYLHGTVQDIVDHVRLVFKGGVQAGDVSLGAINTLVLFWAMRLDEVVVSVLREEDRSKDFSDGHSNV